MKNFYLKFLFLLFCFSFGFIVKAEIVDVDDVLKNLDNTPLGSISKGLYTIDYDKKNGKITFEFNGVKHRIIFDVKDDKIVYNLPIELSQVSKDNIDFYRYDTYMVSLVLSSMYYTAGYENVLPVFDMPVAKFIDSEIYSKSFTFDNDEDNKIDIVYYACLSLDVEVTMSTQSYDPDAHEAIRLIQINEESEVLDEVKKALFEGFSGLDMVDPLYYGIEPENSEEPYNFASDLNDEEVNEENQNETVPENLGSYSIIGYIFVFLLFIFICNIFKKKKMFNKI